MHSHSSLLKPSQCPQNLGHSNFPYQQMDVGGTGHRYCSHSIAHHFFESSLAYTMHFECVIVLWALQGTCNSLFFPLQIRSVNTARSVRMLPADPEPNLGNTVFYNLSVNFFTFRQSTSSSENEVWLAANDVSGGKRGNQCKVVPCLCVIWYYDSVVGELSKPQRFGVGSGQHNHCSLWCHLPVTFPPVWSSWLQ